MIKKWVKGKGRVIAVLIAVILIMCGIGILMNFRLRQLMRSYAEKQVTEQARTLASLSLEQFKLEIKNLERIAGNISPDGEADTAILELVIGDQENVEMGILCLDGKALVGNPLNFSDFSGIQDSFRGNSAVCYSEGKGILFTTPVFDGENVRYTLYKLYDDSILSDKFGISCYNGGGRVALVDEDGQVIVPFSDGSSATAGFIASDIIQSGLMKLAEKMNVDTAATVYCQSGQGDSFLFMAEVKQLGIYLLGNVPEALVMEGISTITAMILWVFGLLILMFVIGIVYLLGAEEKAKESDELREAKNMAEKANRAKSDFLANMSHEIRTPINAIMGMNEMVLRESRDEEIRRYAANIQSASRTLLSIINDILDFSKIEAGRMEIVTAPYDVAVFLNDVVNMIEVKAVQKQLDFQLEIDRELPSVLCGDEVRNRQIIVNILNNAVKYTKNGWIKLQVKGIREEASFTMKFQVSDSGIGIREEDLSKLFEGFQRLDLEQNRNIEGTGLGLAITHSLVEQMNGNMEVSSEYGKGSVFTVYLRQEIRDDRPIGDFRQRFENVARQEEKYQESFTAPEAKVLVVDDNEMNLMVVKALLKKTKLQITTCMSGAECLETAKRESFDVILLDHMMPEMDGIETLSRLKQSENKCREVPVIALTANAIVGAKEEYLKAGFANYLSKPIEGTLLESMLRLYIPKEKLILPKPSVQEDGKILQEVGQIQREEKHALQKTGQLEEEAGQPMQQTEKLEEAGLPLQQTEQLEEAGQPLQQTGQLQEKEKEESQGTGNSWLAEFDSKPCLNKELGIQYCADSEEFYREMLELFCDGFDERASNLEEALATNDWKTYTVYVHGLKSTSLNIGGERLSEAAKRLELAGKAVQNSENADENMEIIKAHHEDVMDLYRMTILEIKKFLDKEA